MSKAKTLPDPTPENVAVDEPTGALAAATRQPADIIDALARENYELREQLKRAVSESERLADTCYVLQAAPRPVVNTIIGPIEATAAGLNRIALELYRVKHGA